MLDSQGTVRIAGELGSKGFGETVTQSIAVTGGRTRQKGGVAAFLLEVARRLGVFSSLTLQAPGGRSPKDREGLSHRCSGASVAEICQLN